MKHRLTQSEIFGALSDIKGAKIIGLTTITPPKMRKTGNPHFGKVHKLSRVAVMVNFNYDAGVVRRLIKEGKSVDDFKRGESWHEPVLTPEGHLTPFCKHKTTGEMYLRVVRLGGRSRFIDDKGRFFPKSEIEPFLQDQDGYKNQGLDNPVVFLTIKLSNVVAIKS